MIHRRDFLQTSLIAGISYLALPRTVRGAVEAESGSAPDYQLTRDVPTKLFDGEKCWCHPRAGIVPRGGEADMPRVVMTMNTVQLEGSDVFKSMFGLRTDDLGKTWTEARPLENMAVRHEMFDGQRRPVAASDFSPKWHETSKTLLGTGHTVVYTPDWRVTHPRPKQTAYSVYNTASGRWRPWRKLEMPPGEKFQSAGAGCTQRVDLADGTILLPIVFSPPEKNSHVTVTRCAFDGETLRYLEHGDVLNINNATRGLHEPSLARFDGMFYMTIRNDETGFVTRGKDGLNFEPYREWTFDDGTPLGSYNTQQHWAVHSDGLFLVYTRRGADNDHVFRHRAPLFMAQVDPQRLRVIRETERILVPERGARLGNFGVTHISPEETWVTVAEWMQPRGVEKYGSDGSVFVARIHWAKPNVGQPF